jgi:hypothetical protein
MGKRTDATLSWLLRDYPELFPQLAQWRDLAVQWIKSNPFWQEGKLYALTNFFERYLIAKDLPLDPKVFLENRTTLPDFYQEACPQSQWGRTLNNQILSFLDFVSKAPVDGPKRQPRGAAKNMDTTLSWLRRDYPELFPQLAQWRDLAVAWVETHPFGLENKLDALSFFFERYLIASKLPLDPKVFFEERSALPDFYQTACPHNSHGITVNNYILGFLEFASNGFGSPKRQPAGMGKATDLSLSWLQRDYAQLFPQLARWHELAVEWIKDENTAQSAKLEALSMFFERYLIAKELPLDPKDFLDGRTVLPDFYQSVGQQTAKGVTRNNYILAFLDFVLLRDFSQPGFDGQPTALPSFRNPLLRRTQKGALRSKGTMVDEDLSWIPRDNPELYSQLAVWHELAVEWLKGQRNSLQAAISALRAFFIRYLVAKQLPLDPRVFFDSKTVLPDFYKTACSQTSSGITQNSKIHDFLNLVLKECNQLGSDRIGAMRPSYRNPVQLLSFNSNGEPTLRREAKREDSELSWLAHSYPHLFPRLAQWRDLAVEWIKDEQRGLPVRLQALGLFFERYLIAQNLPVDLPSFFARGRDLPDFYETVCPQSTSGVGYNNYIHNFLHSVLLKECSSDGDDGQRVISPAFRNPVPRLSTDGMARPDETVHSPLPYGYIDELRQMVVQGPNFRDWAFVQGLEGVQLGKSGKHAPSWFPVTESQIDKNDPDCVWRIRTTKVGHKILEMWSPVRWVALLLKLILPLRTFQVRVLDSGEADTWRFVADEWIPNTNKLAEGSPKQSLQLGVFRRSTPQQGDEAESTVLYINTNKTADAKKSGTYKGYVVPWIKGGSQHQDAYYWLEKLRDWQEKYNPIERRTSWTELRARHGEPKTEVQLAGYSDACFLFRIAEGRKSERHLPITDIMMSRPWVKLLEALESRLARRGEKHQNGDRIRFICSPGEGKSELTTYFPLHSLRVSLITALALEGQAPFPIMQKLVGHSRLLMTLYYVKPGEMYIREILQKGKERLETNKEASIQNFLLNTDHERLLKEAICNDVESIAAVIPKHPAARNAAGWMMMMHGLCLVGGNTSEIENNSLGGCFNGGAIVGDPSRKLYGPVPGGTLNCVRCRWFVTKPEYLLALWAQVNNLNYHLDEARNTFRTRNEKYCELQKLRADAEEQGLPFERMQALRQAERLTQTAAKNFDNLALDLEACVRLTMRCMDVANASQGNGNQLVAVGSIADIQAVFEAIESELLQLSEVCEDVEIHPDLNPGKAVLRRSQLLDNVLYNNDFKPYFMQLGENEQLIIGNAFLRELAKKMNPSDLNLGRREVINLMDAGEKLSQIGIQVETLLPNARQNTAVLSAGSALYEDEHE